MFVLEKKRKNRIYGKNWRSVRKEEMRQEIANKKLRHTNLKVRN